MHKGCDRRFVTLTQVGSLVPYTLFVPFENQWSVGPLDFEPRRIRLIVRLCDGLDDSQRRLDLHGSARQRVTNSTY